MKKRGQFYLVAALVIIAVVASLTVVYNETKTLENDLVIYDLSEEINFEILQLLDSGYFNSLDSEQLNSSINSIMESYSKTYPQTNIVLIYGDINKVNVLAYFTDDSGEICFQGCFAVTEKKFYSRSYNIQSEGAVSITINGEAYTFNVNQYGQNFYLVLRSEDQNGQIFTTTTETECTVDQDCNLQREYCLNGVCQAISEEDCGGENQRCCPEDECNNPEVNICYELVENGQTILDKKCYRKCGVHNLPSPKERDEFCNSLTDLDVDLRCRENTDKCEVS